LHYATSGAEALDRLAAEIEPTLVAVLSDINMPGMDGLQLLVEIRQRSPGLPVMMVTAYGDDERRRQATNYGASGARQLCGCAVASVVALQSFLPSRSTLNA
jgi:CheY-like chemotaxis protein